MTTLTHERRPSLLGLVLTAMAIVVTALALQWARGSWPFGSRGALPAASSAQPAASGHEGHGAPPPLPGFAPVMIEPGRQGGLGLSFARVEERDLTKSLRTVGTISLDETRTTHVHSKVRGWIDTISVDFVGQDVKAGEVLVTLYSQEVYAAEIELLATPPGALLAAARRRLTLWDVPPKEIAHLERTRQPHRAFPLVAPRAGTVVAKQALEGMYVDAALELYTLSDLSRVWVQADLYEADVGLVRPGDTATLRVEGLPEPVLAKVTFLSPTLDEATRTRKVRFELPNRDRALLPGAFVSVELDLALGRGLTVPEDAVIRTGTRSIVFVAHGDPPQHFEAREVTLGAQVGDHVVVERGLSAGERVATGAQFLLDSESRLKASSAAGGGNVHTH